MTKHKCLSFGVFQSYLGNRPKCFQITKNNEVILLRISENAVYAEWTVLWRVLIQLWDKWPKCLIEKKQTDLEHTTTLQKKHYQGKYAKEMIAHALLKPLPHLNKSHKTWAEHVALFKANWKHARKLLCFFGAARTCI